MCLAAATAAVEDDMPPNPWVMLTYIPSCVTERMRLTHSLTEFTLAEVLRHIHLMWGPALTTTVHDAATNRRLLRVSGYGGMDDEQGGAASKDLLRVADLPALLVRRQYGTQPRGGKFVRIVFGHSYNQPDAINGLHLLIGRSTTPALVLATLRHTLARVVDNVHAVRLVDMRSGKFLGADSNLFDALADEAILMADDSPPGKLARCTFTIVISGHYETDHDIVSVNIDGSCAQVCARLVDGIGDPALSTMVGLGIMFDRIQVPMSGPNSALPFCELPEVKARIAADAALRDHSLEVIRLAGLFSVCVRGRK